MQSDSTASSTSGPKRKLPKQRANETRMVDAAIALLQDHTVAEVTNVAVADASQTQPSYVTRYFGSRDEFLLVVAEELAGRIAARNFGLRVLLSAPDGNTRFAGIFAVPEVESWLSSGGTSSAPTSSSGRPARATGRCSPRGSRTSSASSGSRPRRPGSGPW